MQGASASAGPISCPAVLGQPKTSDIYTTLIRRGLFHGVGATFVAVFSYVTASRFPFVHDAYLATIAAIRSLYPEPHATRVAGAQQLFRAAAGGLRRWAKASSLPHPVWIH